MSKVKKIGVFVAAAASIAGVAGVSARAVECARKKWFLRGFEAGQLMGSLTEAESFARDKTAIQEQYDKLCEEYKELEQEYDELCDEYYE